MSLFTSSTTYSAIAAIASTLAAIASASAAWGNLKTAKQNLFNQSMQTHRANLKNLADACNDHFPHIEGNINDPESIKHLYYIFNEVSEAMDSVKEDANALDSLKKYFYINLKYDVHKELKKTRYLEELIHSGILSEAEIKTFRAFILSANMHYESIKIK